VYAHTKKECAAKLAKAISENHLPYYRNKKMFENQTVASWCRFWFETYCSPGLRPNTVNSYKNCIEKHIIPYIGEIKLSQLTSMCIQRLYNELKERGRLDSSGMHTYEPLSASAVRHTHMILNNCLGQAVKERMIPFNPCENCRIPKLQKKERVVLPTEKMGAYLEAAKEEGVYPIFLLELTSGLRRGELLALNWSDLDVQTRTLKINKQICRINGELVVTVPKTANAIRTIMLPQQTVDILIEEHNRHPESPLMFCSPRTNGYWSPDAMWRLHKRILMTAGIDEPVRFHDLRHTFATIAIQNGVDVKTVASMLGHHSAAFTLDTYTHVTTEMQRGAAEKIGVYLQSNVQINVNVIQPPLSETT
jgi:integrase